MIKTAVLLTLALSVSSGLRPARAESGGPTAPGSLLWTDTSGTLFVARADGSATRTVALPPHESLSGLASNKAGDRVSFVMSRSQVAELWTVAADGTDPRQVVGALDPRRPTWSPDGTRIAYQSGLASLRVIGADGRGDRLVTAVAGQVDSPEWAPNGTEVVFAHNIYTNGWTIEVVDVDRTAVPRVIATTDSRTFNVHWSPDGSQLSYVLPKGLFVVDSAGRQSVRVGDGGDPTFAGGAPWSPDGRSLLFCSLRSSGGFLSGASGAPLAVVDVASRTSRVVGSGPCFTPAWSPDGNQTAVVDFSQGDTSHLVIRTANGGLVADFGKAWGIGVVWARSPGAAPTVSGYRMVSTAGEVFAFGDADWRGNAPNGPTAAADIETSPSGKGYWIVDAVGQVFSFGDAPYLGGLDRLRPGESATSISGTRSGKGYWIFTTKGRVITFGDARSHGDMSDAVLNGPVLDSIPTPSGQGYYMVASDGGIFTFGDAAFHGSMGATKLNAPVQSLVPDTDGVGYWLVASDGGIFAFAADFYGSMGGTRLNRPVTGMVGDRGGYLMVAEDGGIFTFGEARFRGSLGANPPTHPVVSVATLPFW